MNFCAIDFETATKGRNSACSVAVVEVAGGVIKDKYYTLIKPPNNYYLQENIDIHGIQPKDTANAPSFSEIWQELSSRLSGKIVVAHNASFDMGVLKECLKDFGCKPVPFNYCCTVKIARKAWPSLPNHKLNTVADHLNISFHHHDALEDAITCAYIPIKAAEDHSAKVIEQLALNLGVEIKPFKM